MYYIDGNNLEGVIPEVAVGTARAEQLVIQLVQAWAKRQNRKVTLAFDGHRSQAPQARGITLVYPGSEDKNADDVLRRLILRDPHKNSATLVTNDSELIRFARANGVQHIYAREFVRILSDNQRDLRAELADRKPAAPEGQEVEKWMRYFGVRPGENRRK